MDAATPPPTDELGDTGSEVPSLIEIEYEGETYQVPAILRGAFLRQQDYTKKTQRLAREKRSLDRARAALSMQLVAQQQHVRDIAALVTLDEQLKGFAQTNWPMLRQQNPQGAAVAFQRMLQLTQARNAVAESLRQKINGQATLAQQMRAKQVADGERVLRRDIRGWDKTMATRLRDYAVSLGFSPQELAAVTDPRIVKALHRAYQADQQAAGAGAAAVLAAEPSLRPLSQLARRASPADIDLSDRMSTADWISARNRQVRQRKGKH